MLDNKFILSSVTQLAGIGPSIATRLAKLGITRVGDLLFHLPVAYQDKTCVVNIADLHAQQQAVVIGEITKQQRLHNKQTILNIADATGSMSLRFFNFTYHQQQSFKIGSKVKIFGKALNNIQGMTMLHPECQLLYQDTVPEEYLTAIYPAVAGLHQRVLRKIINQVMIKLEYNPLAEDVDKNDLPQELQAISCQSALFTLHQPHNTYSPEELIDNLSLPRLRLAFEELLAHRLYFLQLKKKQTQQYAHALNKNDLTNLLLSSLPFQLTADQVQVLSEIRADLSQNTPMLRLLQGDVGSGKTLIALLAILQAASSGMQTAFMVPTEILSAQHFNYCCTLLEADKFNKLKIVRLSAKMKAAEKKLISQQISSGEAQIIIGTHALLQQQINFFNLSLIIIDEQQKFGVEQRLALNNKANNNITPHQLFMTATPIPRTLAMTIYADLNVSVIKHLPPGRIPISTSLLSNNKRAELIQRILNYCTKKKAQVYWVCPLIEESDKINAQAAVEVHTDLVKSLPNLSIGLIHGRMKEEKQEVMLNFSQGKIDLLVATSVIEVGVNVPNASLMIIDNAERLSLTQMHQLRGRVGRGSKKSYCILLYHHPISALAQQRLQVMKDNICGFIVAEKDLHMRGCGELLGVQQSGLINFKIADLIAHQNLFSEVATCAPKYLDDVRGANLIAKWGVNQDLQSITA